MRLIMRFLMLGLVVFVGFPEGIQPVRADDKLAGGRYVGEIDMALHAQYSLNQSSFGQTYVMNTSINWFWNPLIVFQIADNAQGLVKFIDNPMDISDYTLLDATGRLNCSGSASLRAKGLFTQLAVETNNFDQQDGGKVNLLFQNLESIRLIRDTQDCPVKSLVSEQIDMMERASALLGQIILKVTDYNDYKIVGKCSLPGWEDKGAVQTITYNRVNDVCSWWATRQGDAEWKRK